MINPEILIGCEYDEVRDDYNRLVVTVFEGEYQPYPAIADPTLIYIEVNNGFITKAERK